MAKEMLLYSGIYDYTASQYITALDENMSKAVKCRINSGGGSVASTYGMCIKTKEHGKVHMHVDGVAFSGAFNLLMYADNVSCLNVSTFMLHRADMYASTDEEKAFVRKINADLRAQMEVKVPEATLVAVTGYTYDQVFAEETRLNVFLDASQMKRLGIVKDIVELTPSAMVEMDAIAKSLLNIAANGDGIDPEKITTTKTFSKMTIEKLKAENPELYNQVLAQGAAQERDRVESILAFNEVDPAGCKAAIESGKPLTEKQRSDFAMKIHAAASLKVIAEGSAPGVVVGEEAAGTKGTEAETAKAKELSAFYNAAVTTAKSLG